jgi:hypothetical protein
MTLLPLLLLTAAAYPRLEVAFELPNLTGNPFDYRDNDVQVTFAGPDGASFTAPAFFDGGATWRARHTPDRPGRWRVNGVSLNGKEIALRFEPLPEVSGPATPGFVRIDPADPKRFVTSDGAPYLPLGHNIAWGDRQGDVPWYLKQLGAAGGNWSRIWMNHWDGKNLDWPRGNGPLGTLNLGCARKWDGIVAAAEAAGVHFQMTLQHHGQVSTRVNPNWPDHPWNQARGGWLARAEDFFTDPQAIALTKAKYRYIIARYGYSPSVMAWELFNEVQYADAWGRNRESVRTWHHDMAAFIRSQDPWHHLITTSSDLDPGLYQGLDYYQPHHYPSDLLSAIAGQAEMKTDRPLFIGEMGIGGDLSKDDGRQWHQILWGSLLSPMAGAAQYWAWDTVARNKLWPQLAGASAFVKASGLASLKPGPAPAVEITTAASGPLSFGPGGGWGPGGQREFTVKANGAVAGAGQMPAYLQGRGHQDLFQGPTFKATWPAAGTFAVSLSQIAKSGAHLVVTVDGQTAAERDFPAGGGDQAVDATLTAPVAAGPHTVAVRNTGSDWVVVKRFTFDPFVAALAALAKGDEREIVVWVHRRAEGGGAPISGQLTVAAPAGAWSVTWYDTLTGAASGAAQSVTAGAAGLVLATPGIERDAVMVARRP